jgi:hypothetical protein
MRKSAEIGSDSRGESEPKMAAKSKRVLKFFASSPAPKKESHLDDHEAADILGTLYGSITSSRDLQPRRIPEQQQPPKTSISVRALGYGWTVDLTKEECDTYLRRVMQNDPLIAQNVVDETFLELYNLAFSSADPKTITPGAYLYLYSVLALGSLTKPSFSMEEVPSVTQALFGASSSLVGSAIIESSINSVRGLMAFSALCVQTGQFLSHIKFARLAFQLMVTLGYHRQERYFTRTIESDSELRIFWNVYLRNYLYSVFFTSGGDTDLNLDKVTASPPPIGSSDDFDSVFLDLKVKLVGFHSSTVANLRKAPLGQVASILSTYFSQSQGLRSVALSQLGSADHRANTSGRTGSPPMDYRYVYGTREGRVIPRRPFSNLYYTMFISILIHVDICVFKAAPVQSSAHVSTVRDQCIVYLDSIHRYMINSVDDEYVVTAWFLSHHMVLAMMVLLYCQQMGGTTDGDRSLSNGVHCLLSLKSHVPHIDTWLGVIEWLQEKAQGPTLPPLRDVKLPSSYPPSPDMKGNCSLDSFLSGIDFDESLGWLKDWIVI